MHMHIYVYARCSHANAHVYIHIHTLVRDSRRFMACTLQIKLIKVSSACSEIALTCRPSVSRPLHLAPWTA